MSNDPKPPRRTPVKLDQLVVRISRFDSEKDRTPRPWEGPFARIIRDGHLVRADKKGTPAFSAAIYGEGAKRGNRKVVEATLLVYDFDHLSAEGAARVGRLLQGRAFLAYTSFSHLSGGPDDGCFRVLLPVTRSIQPDEYPAVWEGGYAALGRLADVRTRDVARIWFLPSCPPERAELAWVRTSDGLALDVDAVLSWQRDRNKQATHSQQTALKLQPATFGEGERNAGLTSLAGSLRRRGMSESGIVAALRAENEARCSPPLLEEEILAIARSVCTYEPGNPLVLANRTDYGNGERLAWFAKDDLRYVHPWEKWLCWDGRRWRPDNDNRVFTRAASMVRTLAAQAETIEDPSEREALRRHAMMSESVARLSSMLRIAGNLLAAAPVSLDRQPWLLNCWNGTVDLRTGQLRPHDRADLLTHLMPTPFEPEALCPLWEAFLERIFDGNRPLIDFVQRAVGYSLTGLVTEQVLFLAIGTGQNGKSTFFDVLRRLLGDYVTNAEFSTFLKRGGDGVRNDLARLASARVVSASEPERGKPLAESLVKQLTGGDAVTVRFLFKEFFEYLPAFKVWLAGNSRPTISGSDAGIWRRIRLIPFSVKIPDDERDRMLGIKLVAELPGILAWAVRGCMLWQSEGLGLPPEVREANADYREVMDPLPAFLDGHCEIGPFHTVLARDLYEVYLRWSEESGEEALSQKGLANRLQDRGFRPTRGARGVRAWRGLRLRKQHQIEAAASEHEQADEDGLYEEGEVAP